MRALGAPAVRWVAGPPLPASGPATLLDAVLRQAEHTPEAVALEAQGEAWSYAYLVRRAASLGRALRGALRPAASGAVPGVVGSRAPEAPIAVLLEREAVLPAALLGVMAAGLPYLPLDPAYPRERLRYMLRDAGARALLTRRDLARRLEVETWTGGETPVVLLEELGGAGTGGAGAEGAEAGGVHLGERDLAYLLYTSGSTGQPKGVAVEHRGGSALLAWARSALPAALARAVIFCTSVSFDVSVFELFWPLSVGGRVLLVENALTLSREPATQTASFLSASPSLLAELLHQRALPASVQGIGLAGEALPRDLVERVRQLGTVEALYNLYGPSEDTTFSTWHRVLPDAPSPAARPASGAAAAPPIGRPLDGTRVAVLDSRGCPAAPGEAGELCLAGAGLARGYHRRPGLTAERFVPAPEPEAPSGALAPEPGARMYRTGDLVRWLPGGALAFLGRLDQQVKLRGLRIELGEIEVALRACPGVAEAAVLLSAGSDPRLIGFLVADHPGQSPERRGLVARLQDWLPDHMVPSAFITLPAMPRTPSGKLDRVGLREHLRRQPATAEQVAGGSPGAPGEGEALSPFGPGDELARLVASLWREVLAPTEGPEPRGGEASPALDSTFLEAGGNSLLAARLTFRLRESTGREINPVQLLTGLRLGELIERLRAPDARDRDPVAVPPLRRISSSARLPGLASGTGPLNHSQLRLWFLERMSPGSAAFHLPARFLLEGEAPPARLRAALTASIVRHESLRTSFGFDPSSGGPGGGAHARVEEPFVPDLPLVDLSALLAPDRDAETHHLHRREAARPFHLARLPLLRACLLRLGHGRALLLLTVHHIIADGWSLSLLGRELIRHATHPATGRATSDGEALPPLPLQPTDFAAWQQALLASPWKERELGFWRDRLAGAPRHLELPTDRPRPRLGPGAATRTGAGTTEGEPRAGGALPVRVGRDGMDRLRALARRRGVTPFMILLAALDALLTRATGQEDLCVGTYAAGRVRPELEHLVGYFVNDLILRVDASGDPPFRELLGRTRTATLEAQAHQELPHDLVARQGSAAGSPQARGSLFQVVLNLQSFPARFGGHTSDSADEAPRLTLVTLPDTYWAHHDLTFWLRETAGRLEGTLVYDRQLFDPTTVRRWWDHLLVLLAALPKHLEAPISQLPLLAPAAEHQVLREWGQGSPVSELEPDEPVLDAILRQARERPDRLALIAGGAHLSYAQLLREAGGVARRLRGHGVGLDQRVGIWGDRDPAMIPALLGILLAGAAYQPVDPLQPPERVRWLLTDSGARAFLVPSGLAAEAWGGFAGAVLRIGGEPGPTDSPAAGARQLPALPSPPRESAAYVIYTSGSTGRPKGVVLSHHNLATYTETAARAFAITAEDRMLQFNSLGFDASVEEIFPTLTRGATLVLRDEEIAASPAVFIRRLHAWKITIADLPTAYWHLWALFLEEQLPDDQQTTSQFEAPSPEAPSSADWHPEARRREVRSPLLPSCLRIVIIAGERALPERYAGWYRATGLWPRLINTYGPTEATIVASSWEAGSAAEAEGIGEARAGERGGREGWRGDDVPIGRPIRGAVGIVLSAGLTPQPPGFPGELFLGGEGVARGYLDRPALTAERFLPEPAAAATGLPGSRLGGRPGARIYRSGDLARQRRDGLLEFLGRVDAQVKVRGFRVELGEIEAVLRAHPALHQAVVLAQKAEDRIGRGEDGTRLVAYAVLRDPKIGDLTRELRAFVARTLPSYMVPAAFVFPAEIPLSPAGKVDRKALAALQPDTPENPGGSGEGLVTEPTTEIEEILRTLWEALLEVHPIGIHDDFFALGGHSLLVPQLLARIAAAFEIELPVRALFQAPTISTLARLLEDALLAELEAMSDAQVEAAMEG